MDKFFTKIRIIQLNEIILNDNRHLIYVKDEENFRWLLTVLLANSIFYCKGTYFLMTEDSVYIYKEMEDGKNAKIKAKIKK